MNNWLTKNNLLVLVCVLLGVKFVLLPLLDWQAQKLGVSSSKARQLNKIEQVIVFADSYRGHVEQLKAHLVGTSAHLYENDSSTKLDVQRDIEKIFEEGGLDITGFSWVLDTLDASGSYRVLRATVYFTGSVTTMMQSFWGLAISSRLYKVVTWNQQLKSSNQDPFGFTEGNITLDFIAVRAGFLQPKDAENREVVDEAF
tara:strand:- start:365 stop:964 length:600 start_codon:yes stop_codon:yes gene_type:complete